MNLRTLIQGCFLGLGALLVARNAAAEEPFSYNPPGMLVQGSGEGRFDENVYAPGMRFPIETGPAYLNSQVWGHGGSAGPGGGQCDPENRSYPWWDNYCEKRTWDMPLCPAGTGHQGQDIRAATCDDDTHWVVAAADGEITSIGGYSVYLTTPEGTRFDYLHMASVQVALNQNVKRGDRLGRVSNAFNGTPTTLHLHFNIRQNVADVGIVFVPTYMSLVTSYQELVNEPPKGEFSSVTCERVTGAAQDPDTPNTPSSIRVSIGGPLGAPGAFDMDVPADRETDLFCEDGETSCLHGFDSFLPASLLDGAKRNLHLYAVDTSGGTTPVELENSPIAVACDVVSLSDKARRRVAEDSVFASWGFSLLLDQALVSPEVVSGLPETAVFPAAPDLLVSASGKEFWLRDGETLRAVSEDALLAHRFDLASAKGISDVDATSAKKGEDWPARPFLVRDAEGALYFLDVATDLPAGTNPNDDDGGNAGAANASCSCGVAAQHPFGEGLWWAALGLGICTVVRRRARGRLVSRAVR